MEAIISGKLDFGNNDIIDVSVNVTDINDFFHADENSSIFYVDNHSNSQGSTLKQYLKIEKIELSS